MSLTAPFYQPSKYVVGSLTLTAGQTKALTEADVEGPLGALAEAPNGLRGWVAVVSSGAAKLLPAEDATLGFVSPSGAYDDPDASDFTGVWFKETSGTDPATISVLARIGGVS